MQIREGAYYRTRGGDVVGPLTGVTWCDRTFMAADMTWNEDGSYVPGIGHEYDLISEVYVSDTPPTERDALKAENTKLRAALLLAIDTVEHWASYASLYAHEKHDLAGDLQKLRAALGEKE